MSEQEHEVDVDVDNLILSETDKPAQVEAVVDMDTIRAMIAQLSVTEEGESLRGAMQDLKKAIKFNPEACVLLLPEDIGEAVKHLLRLTGKDVEMAAAKLKKGGSRTKKVDLSDPKIQQEILDDL